MHLLFLDMLDRLPFINYFSLEWNGKRLCKNRQLKKSRQRLYTLHILVHVSVNCCDANCEDVLGGRVVVSAEKKRRPHNHIHLFDHSRIKTSRWAHSIHLSGHNHVFPPLEIVHKWFSEHHKHCFIKTLCARFIFVFCLSGVQNISWKLYHLIVLKCMRHLMFCNQHTHP